MSPATFSLSDRVQKAAEILSTTPEKVKASLKEGLGIDVDDLLGAQLLDAVSTTEEMIKAVLLVSGEYKLAPLMAAVAWLKGRNPFESASAPTADINSPAPNIFDASKPIQQLKDRELFKAVFKVLDDLKPIQQLKDRELLERYIEERDPEMELELNRRAKNQPFVILKKNGRYEAGKEPIDVEASLDLLKSARKGRTNNTIVSYQGAVANVFRITELNINDRRIELCPICGEALYKSYCERCESSFEGVGKDERAYVHLVAMSGKFNRDSFSDRKALLTSALKGLDDLRLTCPGVSRKFDDLKEADDLPRLVIIENRPSRIADPFHVSGNRSF